MRTKVIGLEIKGKTRIREVKQYPFLGTAVADGLLGEERAEVMLAALQRYDPVMADPDFADFFVEHIDDCEFAAKLDARPIPDIWFDPRDGAYSMMHLAEHMQRTRAVHEYVADMEKLIIQELKNLAGYLAIAASRKEQFRCRSREVGGVYGEVLDCQKRRRRSRWQEIYGPAVCSKS